MACLRLRDVPLNFQDPNFAAALPQPTQNATSLKALFLAKGFSTQELVALSGAHSIGASHNTAPTVRRARPS